MAKCQDVREFNKKTFQFHKYCNFAEIENLIIELYFKDNWIYKVIFTILSTLLLYIPNPTYSLQPRFTPSNPPINYFLSIKIVLIDIN